MPKRFGPTMAAGEKFAAGERYITAYLRGVRDARRDLIERRTDEGLQILVKYSTVKDADLWRKMEFQYTDPNCYNHPDSIAHDIQVFKDAGVVKQTPTDCVDARYRDYAIGRLGRYTP